MDNIIYAMDEEIQNSPKERITRKLSAATSTGKLLLGTVIAAVVLGTLTGYILSTTGGSGKVQNPLTVTPKTPQQDTRTFRDFAEGTIEVRPAPSDPTEYIEGSHFLKREGAVPVALTSSVVDLSKYEGKKVKVFGETQKAIKEGWLMDVGKVEDIQ